MDGVEDATFRQAEVTTVTASPLDLNMPDGNKPLPEPSGPFAGDLVEAYWALDLMQAKFLADRLSDQGIPAVADTHDMHDALGSMRSGPRVWVRAEDLPQAKSWLETYDAQFKAEHGGVERD